MAANKVATVEDALLFTGQTPNDIEGISVKQIGFVSHLNAPKTDDPKQTPTADIIFKGIRDGIMN